MSRTPGSELPTPPHTDHRSLWTCQETGHFPSPGHQSPPPSMWIAMKKFTLSTSQVISVWNYCHSSQQIHMLYEEFISIDFREGERNYVRENNKDRSPPACMLRTDRTFWCTGCCSSLLSHRPGQEDFLYLCQEPPVECGPSCGLCLSGTLHAQAQVPKRELHEEDSNGAEAPPRQGGHPHGPAWRP